LALFRNAQDIQTFSLNQPDNIYSFIVIQSKGNTNRITWAFGSTKVSNEVVQLHNKLMSLTK
jgi:hypothetical protein